MPPLGEGRENFYDVDESLRRERDEAWMLDTGLTCAYDGELIEYSDGVVVLLVVRPYVIGGQLIFYDLLTEDQGDYLYSPLIFHAKNWDDLDEQFITYAEERTPVPLIDPIVSCRYCQSGIRQGETMGIASFGEIHRSQRNPDLKAYGNRFENMDRNPHIFCISCLMDMNKDIHECWTDGVRHESECEDGTYARCWRSGCPGNCKTK